jgi:hypothetical protein
MNLSTISVPRSGTSNSHGLKAPVHPSILHQAQAKQSMSTHLLYRPHVAISNEQSSSYRHHLVNHRKTPARNASIMGIWESGSPILCPPFMFMTFVCPTYETLRMNGGNIYWKEYDVVKLCCKTEMRNEVEKDQRYRTVAWSRISVYLIIGIVAPRIF